MSPDKLLERLETLVWSQMQYLRRKYIQAKLDLRAARRQRCSYCGHRVCSYKYVACDLAGAA